MKKTLLLIVAALVALTATAQDAPQVKTTAGMVEGFYDNGINVFKGIPFAAPPVGKLRWKAPQPVTPWQGVRKTVEYGPNPMQQPLFGDMNFGTKKMSEDCLYLNIWVPTGNRSYEGLAVLIYFNGGGLMAGAASEARYAGDFMARKGIIVVTANYREGIFGFFAHPELSKETKYHGSGNYGFMDQVAAISWVKDNIKAFGGDPNRITIAGESAGSMSVSALMASPLCKDLFARAIGSSGSVLGFHKVPTQKEAEAAGMEMAKKIGCKNLKALRAMSAEELLERADVKSVPTYNIDGHFFTEQPVTTFEKGRQTLVPLLVGGNSQEMSPEALLQGRPATVANLKEAARRTFGNATDEVFRLYGINTDSDVVAQPGVDLASDMFLGYSTWRWGELHRFTSGNFVYRYRYCHPRPAMVVKGKVAALAGGVVDAAGDAPAPKPDKGAVHSADIEYAMATLPTNRVFDWQPVDYMISNIFSDYYVNFVNTGNPNGLGLVKWLYTCINTVPPVLQIDERTKVTQDEQVEKRYRFIDSLFGGKIKERFE